MRIKKQEDIKDCGLCVLQYLSKKINGYNTEINYLKLNAKYGKNGLNISGFIELGKMIDLAIEAYECNLETLKTINQNDYATVILVKRNELMHYMVLEYIDNGTFYCQDSSVGKLIQIKNEEMQQIFQNKIMLISKRGHKKPNNKELKINSNFSALLDISGYRWYLFFAGILNMVLVFISTFFAKIVFDLLLPNEYKSQLLIIFILFIWLNILRIFNSHLKSIITKKIENKIEMNLINFYFYKINHSKKNFLRKLTTSEYLKRLSYISLISGYHSEFLYVFITELFSFIISLTLLVWVNYILFIVLLVTTILTFLINYMHNLIIEKKYSVSIKKAEEKYSSELSEIMSITNQKNMDHINFIETNRVKKLYEYKNNELNIFNISNRKDLFSNLVMGNLTPIIIVISSFLIFDNKLTIGYLILFLSGISFFTSPILSISSLISTHHIMQKNADLINFVYSFKEMINFNEGIKIKKINQIELYDIKYKYEVGKTIIKIPYLKINQNCCFTGKNGTGKSTLLSIIANEFSDVEGTIKINGQSLDSFNLQDFENNLILISNNNFMSDGNIINYITYGNKEYQLEFYRNYSKYGLSDIFNEMNLELNIDAYNNGSNLSSGQKQLIHLMRLFCKKYHLVLLDEAFENLSKNIYKKIKERIKNYQNEAVFIEISHNRNYVFNSMEVNLDEFNKR